MMRKTVLTQGWDGLGTASLVHPQSKPASLLQTCHEEESCAHAEDVAQLGNELGYSFAGS